MASETGTLYIKSADGTQNIYENASYSFSTSETLSACLSTNAPTVTAVALTIGGTAISDSTSMGDLFFTSAVSGTLTLYDVTPIPAETITGFYLDGTEYKFAGGGGDGDVTGPSSSTDGDVALFDGTTGKLIKDSGVALSSKANASDVLTKTNTTSFTPTGDYQPATKKYVDDHAGTEYNAGQGISIGDISMNARKGPCPEGWHVPSISEWSFIETVLFNLGVVVREYSSGGRSNAIRYLHIPMAGFRINTGIANDGVSVELQASDGYVCFGDISDESDPDITVSNRIACSRGWGIRPFKDTYEAPTSSWTVVVGSLGSNGVFYNQTEGLISVSNGQTGYTMSDKNLGATVVYNYGDTINEANSGYFYQFGNNHGFPGVGNSSAVTVSTTAVDITGYGPNNYYNSDTFVWITGPQSQQAQWWIGDGSDLWGGVSGTISQENVISNTGVLSVNGQTGNVTIPESNVIAMTQAAYDALPAATKNDGKLRIITDATGIEMADKAYVDGLVGDIETLLAAL